LQTLQLNDFNNEDGFVNTIATALGALSGLTSLSLQWTGAVSGGAPLSLTNLKELNIRGISNPEVILSDLHRLTRLELSSSDDDVAWAGLLKKDLEELAVHGIGPRGVANLVPMLPKNTLKKLTLKCPGPLSKMDEEMIRDAVPASIQVEFC
jgi:hypothetical protein